MRLQEFKRILFITRLKLTRGEHRVPGDGHCRYFYFVLSPEMGVTVIPLGTQGRGRGRSVHLCVPRASHRSWCFYGFNPLETWGHSVLVSSLNFSTLTLALRPLPVDSEVLRLSSWTTCAPSDIKDPKRKIVGKVYATGQARRLASSRLHI